MIASFAGSGFEGYDQLFHISPVGMALIDADTRMLVKVNPALCKLTGRSESELLAANTSLFEQPGGSGSERSILRKDGSAALARVAETPYSDPVTGRPMLAATYLDATEEHRFADALARSEEWLHFGFETAGIGLWEKDLETGRLRWDRQLCALFGYRGDEFDDWTEALAKAIDPEESGRIVAKMAAAAENGELCECQFKIARISDGRERWIQAFGRAHPATSAAPERMVGIVVDRTEEVRARQALEESEEHYRHAIELNPQVPWTALPDGSIESFNERWLTITGMAREEALGDGWKNVVHPDDLEATARAWRHSVETSLPVDLEARIRYADGQYRWMRARAFPRFNEKGELVRWYGTNEDVHDRKLAQEKLEERVRQRTADLESFVHAVAHDLRGPMRAIGSTSQILLEDHGADLCEEARSLLSRQTHAIARMNGLIDGLLRYALLGMVDPKRAEFDLTAKALSVAADVERRYCEVRFEIEEGMRAEADPACIRMLLENLFENAAKYSPGGGLVTFGHDAEANAYRVGDEGIGFDPRDAERIFGPFSRLVSGSRYPGAGLGLASVRKVAEMHGGRAWAESSPGRGSAFYFTLGGN